MTVPIAMAVVLFTLSLVAGSASGQEAIESQRPKIYKWIDENGIAHYTTNIEQIPSILRNKIETLGATKEKRSEVEAQPPISRPGILNERGFDRDAAPPQTGDLESWDSGPINVNNEELANIETRISDLENEIAADELVLKTIVSTDSGEGGPTQEQTDQFREISARLPKLLTELTALRLEREQLEQ